MPANHRAIGEIAPSSTSTGTAITANIAPNSENYPCQAIQLQILESATGYVYILEGSATATLTGANANVVIALHPDGPVSWSVGNPAGLNPLNAAGYYVVPAVSGQGVRGSVLKTGAY